MAAQLRKRLRVAPGEPVDLAALDARATPLAPGGKTATRPRWRSRGRRWPRCRRRSTRRRRAAAPGGCSLTDLDPHYPAPDLDVRALKKRLAPPG
jgi:hypothetical protein